MSGDIVEVKKRYDDICGGAKSCSVKVDVDEKMDKTVHIYYELHNFHQNHRIYMKSLNREQLEGKSISESTADSDCDPAIFIRHFSSLETVSNMIASNLLRADDVAYPCGLIAKSFFNDRYAIVKDTNGVQVDIDEKKIAWSDDRGKYEKSGEPGAWLDMTDEHFIVWMRVAGLPTFRKHWGRIEPGLEEGTYTVTVENNYDVSKFSGKKYIVLTTVNAFGGKNYVLGSCFLGLAGLAVILCIAFLGAYKIKQSRETLVNVVNN
eukprot:TRINITY_DN6141_c0_g1_i24.p1 TRINITY_DN6141_c0_g1~~TRINITY_DN6141_c0_g1_i24.p1  ORF type:complete len:264 (-),score=50.56 TRINITY_DN6141_c0_g1_i24:99-890(-)